jgi:hypothetical protein
MAPYEGREPWTPVLAEAIAGNAERHAEALVRHPRVRVVDFDDLDSMSTLYSLWEWCLRGRVPWSPERAAMLRVLKVEIIAPKIYADEDAMRSLLGVP